MGDQTNHYLYGFGLTYCLTTEGAEPDKVKRCYYRYFPLCAKICTPELDTLVADCGYDNRTLNSLFTCSPPRPPLALPPPDKPLK